MIKGEKKHSFLILALKFKQSSNINRTFYPAKPSSTYYETLMKTDKEAEMALLASRTYYAMKSRPN